MYGRNKCRSESALQHNLRGPPAVSNPHFISLSGPDWAFKLFDRPESVPKAFWEAAFDDGQWGKVGSSDPSAHTCNIRGAPMDVPWIVKSFYDLWGAKP